MNVPLGLAESQTLEFQSARILDKPDWTRTVAREVVAFLNTELGGTLWIGLREESSTAVKVEDVADAESRRAALWDALLDRVEPRLAEGEVEIAVVRHDPTGACLLMIEIHGCCARGPWAALEGSGRQFLVRAGPHVRPLGRDELAQAFRDRHQAAEQEERRERETWETLVARRNDLQARGWCGLWVAVAPTSGVQVAGLGGEGIAALFRDPSLTGNRDAGWNFVNPYRAPSLDAEGLTSARQDALVVRLSEDGRLTLQVALENLFWKGNPQSLYPHALMEQPTALLRLASILHRDHLISRPADSAILVGDLALLGVEGWTLGSSGLLNAGVRFREQGAARGPHVTRTRPFRWTMGNIRDHPDRCAFTMVAWLYRAFGHPESNIPRVFDPLTGLVFPDR